MKEFIRGLFLGEENNPSSKRFIGIIGGLSLIGYMFIYPGEYSNTSVLIMSLGALGITSMEAVFKKGK